MDNSVVFNITICIIGILILLVQVNSLFLKKDKRKDEKALLLFIAFTAFHFFIYLVFAIIKINHTSNAFIMTFYTIFYIFNNLEVYLLFIYMLTYLSLNKKIVYVVNISLFSVFVLLDFINLFTGIFFYAEDGIYIRNKLMILSQGYQFVMLAMIFFITITNKKTVIREKIAFGLYCALPLIAIILQNVFKGYAIAYASIIISVEILFFFVNVQKNIDLSIEEEKNKDVQIKLMLSQIQPHFIYNSLSSISTLITIEPEKAQKALDDFTDYLRGNLSSLTETKLVSFSSELKHIETYVALEKIRFNNRINVIYETEAIDFLVPPLTIQPIVENAIKHGILKKLDGGTVIIKTYETDLAYVIEIIDDGVGFDMKDVDFNSNLHFGLNNIKYRINKTTNGSIDVYSEMNKGTKVVVRLNKEVNK